MSFELDPCADVGGQLREEVPREERQVGRFAPDGVHLRVSLFGPAWWWSGEGRGRRRKG